MIDENELVGLDIETTGLNPHIDRVRAVGLAARDGTKVLVSDEELDLLTELEELVLALPARAAIVTWNGEEFDMPFLAMRFEQRDIASTLRVKPTAGVGKYGRPLFSAYWGSHRHIDIAPLYRREAESAGVAWNLKPIAKAFLGVQPVEVDRTGSSISKLERAVLARYVASDAQITLDLAIRLGTILEPA